MPTSVSRDLAEINDEVKKLDKELKKSTDSTKKLDKSLRLDPTNTTLLAAKTEQLQKSITTATSKIKALRQEQEKMKASDPNAIGTESYKKLTIEIAKTEAQVKSLEKSMKEVNNVSLSKLEGGLKSASKVAIATIAAVVALETAYANAGDAISKASDKFNISAEAFQKNSYIFEQTTSDADGYSRALTELQSKISQAEKGSAKAVTSFEALGISIEELSGKSSAEALNLVISKLNEIEDYDQRVTVANELLSSSGTEVAMVAGLTADELERLNAQAEKNGLVTQDQADKAAALSDKITDLKNKYASVGAELAEALLPMMKSLMSVANALAPVISALANIFNALGGPLQLALTLLLGLLAVAPKLVAGIKAVNAAMTVLGANPINLKIMAIALAVSALIMLLVQLAKWLNSIFNKNYDLDINAGGMNTSDLINQASSASAAYETAGATYITNNYEIEQNNVVNNDLDIDDVAEQLTTKIRVGGGK